MTDEFRLKGLLQRGLAGDRAAYKVFLMELGNLLERQIRRQLRSMGRVENDAEDIVQEALIAIHTKRHTYDWETPVTAWARAIVHYKYVDWMRKRARLASEIALDESLMVEGANGSAVETESAVQSMMRSLPEKQRRAIELTKVAGYSNAEAARLTGTSEAAVKTNVHRGLKALARMWKR